MPQSGHAHVFVVALVSLFFTIIAGTDSPSGMAQLGLALLVTTSSGLLAATSFGSKSKSSGIAREVFDPHQQTTAEHTLLAIVAANIGTIRTGALARARARAHWCRRRCPSPSSRPPRAAGRQNNLFNILS
ncbi:hypothetical protein T492DRAFT_913786 [Pavlovales sp. CCMP2436]|nr:hypothetical protein T492DRAFT_913786 [Pavlovales sp. CCMP2436]